METLILTLPQLIDTALSPPEVGSVSYTLINHVLQVICQQLNLQDVKVQYQGIQALQIEKLWDPETKTMIPTSTILKKVEEIEEGKETGDKVVVIPEGSSTYPEMTLTIDNTRLQNMEKNIENLQIEVENLKYLPANTELLHSIVDKNEDSTPLVDMYHRLSISKRMDATEEATKKIGSMVQDLARIVQGDDTSQRIDARKIQKVETPAESEEELIEETEHTLENASLATADEMKEKSSSESIPEPPSSQKTEEGYYQLEDKMADENWLMANLPGTEAMHLIHFEMDNLKLEIRDLKRKIEFDESESRKTHYSGAEPSKDWKHMIFKRVHDVEEHVDTSVKQINKMDSVFSSSYDDLFMKIVECENNIRNLFQKVQEESGKPDMEEHLSSSIYEVSVRVGDLETAVERISEGFDNFIDDSETNKKNIKSFMDEVSAWKFDMIGREEFVEALAEKVDLCVINRKVSHDQFNATCDDLSRGIEEALEKLIEQEDLWHHALKEIQEEVNQKLGREDFDSLRNFIADKLKGMQRKVKTLGQLREEREAATSKTKFLKDIECLSCNKDVIMRKKVNVSDYPVNPPLPSHKTIAPHVAYELDYMRNQKTGTKYKDVFRFDTATRDDQGVIKRHCGGEHTITTPQQRIARMGNFMEQWGPQDESKKENVVEKQPKTGKLFDFVLPSMNRQDNRYQMNMKSSEELAGRNSTESITKDEEQARMKSKTEDTEGNISSEFSGTSAKAGKLQDSTEASELLGGSNQKTFRHPKRVSVPSNMRTKMNALPDIETSDGSMKDKNGSGSINNFEETMNETGYM